MKKMARKILALVLALACVMSIGIVSAFADSGDGTYTVPVQAWRETQNHASMADVLGPNATAVISDGQVTMTVPTKSMEMMDIRGDLVGLRVSDGKGGFTTAQAVGTDSEGNPTAFTFTVPESLYRTGYIPIKETAKTTPHFPGMDGEQDARIKIDLASAKKVTSTPEATKTDATTGASSNPLSKVFSQVSSLLKK